MNASIRPSRRLSVRVQTHVQMSAGKRRDQDGVHEINGFGFLVPPNQNFGLVVSVPRNIIPQAHVISSDVKVKLQI